MDVAISTHAANVRGRMAIYYLIGHRRRPEYSMAERAAPRLGAHMSIAGGLPRAVDRAYATRCESLQIFTKSAGQWRARSLSCDEVEAFRMRARELDVRPIVAHASYLINVAAPDRTLRRRSMAALVEEMNRADALGLLGLVPASGLLHDRHRREGTAIGRRRRERAPE